MNFVDALDSIVEIAEQLMIVRVLPTFMRLSIIHRSQFYSCLRSDGYFFIANHLSELVLDLIVCPEESAAEAAFCLSIVIIRCSILPLDELADAVLTATRRLDGMLSPLFTKFIDINRTVLSLVSSN